ncbi:MAG: hypothetical protein HY517_04850 [Candidatus Aenigmarchaeota archaeon]|nr:hypothetical protein [Candidatus Aenigmarchaeota archaeon]
MVGTDDGTDSVTTSQKRVIVIGEHPGVDEVIISLNRLGYQTFSSTLSTYPPILRLQNPDFVLIESGHMNIAKAFAGRYSNIPIGLYYSKTPSQWAVDAYYPSMASRGGGGKRIQGRMIRRLHGISAADITRSVIGE